MVQSGPWDNTDENFWVYCLNGICFSLFIQVCIGYGEVTL